MKQKRNKENNNHCVGLIIFFSGGKGGEVSFGRSSGAMTSVAWVRARVGQLNCLMVDDKFFLH